MAIFTTVVDSLPAAYAMWADMLSGRTAASKVPPERTDWWLGGSPIIAWTESGPDMTITSAPGAGDSWAIQCPKPPNNTAGLLDTLQDSRLRRAIIVSFSGPPGNPAVVSATQNWLNINFRVRRRQMLEMAWPFVPLWINYDSPYYYVEGAGQLIAWIFANRAVIYQSPEELWGNNLGSVSEQGIEIWDWAPYSHYSSGTTEFLTPTNPDDQAYAASIIQWPGSGEILVESQDIQAINAVAERLNNAAGSEGSAVTARGRTLLKWSGASGALDAVDHSSDNATRRLAQAINALFGGYLNIRSRHGRAQAALTKGVIVRG